MKVSLFAPLVSPVNDAAYVSALAKGAEARGFHSIWLGEHVVLFDNYDAEYPYEENGKIPVGGDRGLLEPITALSFMAAQTSRIRLGTGICLVPQRNPVYTAKEIAAVDYLSRGRVDFGVGVGWLEEEFTALGVPFARRGARCREYLEVIKSLWTDDVSSYSGEFYQLEPCRHIRNRSSSRDHPYISGVSVMRLCAGSPISVPVGTDSMSRRKMFQDTC